MRRRKGTDHPGKCRGELQGAWWLAVCIVMVLVTASVLCVAEPLTVSGRFGLDVCMIPMPTTLMNNVQLDTPTEFTQLKHSMEASLNFTATWDQVRLDWDSAMNIAGPERVILEGTIPLGPLMLEPELWFAVPFETVKDIDNFTNYAVISPGDMMFVKTRLAVSGSYGGVDFDGLFLIEDVEFPNPSLDFPGPEYTVQSQAFRYGAILTASAEVYDGVTLRSVTNINADGGTNAVKGHSASGRAFRSCSNDLWWNQTLSLSGLQYCNLPFWLRLSVSPCDDPILDLAGGGSLILDFFDLELSGSISLFPVDISGFSFTGRICDSISVGVSLSESLDFQSASLMSSSSLDLGLMLLQISGSMQVVAGTGIPGANLSFSATQGAFSGSMNIAISEQAGVYRMTSYTAQFSVNDPPVAYSLSVSFGRTGLKRATVSFGVVF